MMLLFDFGLVGFGLGLCLGLILGSVLGTALVLVMGCMGNLGYGIEILT